MSKKPNLDYVSRLMRAEEERNRVIAEARQKKIQKVRQAKIDAEQAVGEYRKEKDAELAVYAAQLNNNAQAQKSKATNETERQIDGMRKTANQRVDRVADVLVQMICNVDVGTK